ncbi:MAG: response regulator, partial [Candidatus Cloacimonetes bacterium]|nr:response regulator [Candidatus Cloacimonadota bacterium]
AVQAGAFEYLSKPLNSETFFKVIKDALNHSENITGSLQKAFDPGSNHIQKGEPILLHGFAIENKHDFLALGRIRKYDPGEKIPLDDKALGEIILIEKGEVSVWFNGTIIDYLQKWDFWGEESFILSGVNISTLKAESDVKLRHFNRKDLMEFFSYKGDKLLNRFIINLVNSNFFRWRKSIQRIVMLKLITDQD